MATPKLTVDQIAEVSRLVARYISTQRQKYAPRAVSLSGQQRSAVAAFFAPELLGNTRLLVLQDERVPNPDFYPMLRDLGFKNLTDRSAMAAIIFCDLVVSHGHSQTDYFFTNSCMSSSIGNSESRVSPNFMCADFCQPEAIRPSLWK
jgi:hypothetical protein